MRVAFFGGSFDPPHLGHLRIALTAAERMGLDRVLLAPVAVQPLKRGAGAVPASFADRLAMLRLLVAEAGDARLEVSELDAPRPDGKPNYTFDTLERLRAELGAGVELFLLTGADALTTLPQWHRAFDLILGVSLIVAARPGFPLDELYSTLLTMLAPSAMVRGQESWNGVTHLVLVGAHDPDRPVATMRRCDLFLLEDMDEDISATAVRAALGAGEAAEGMAAPVLAYIREHGLYR